MNVKFSKYNNINDLKIDYPSDYEIKSKKSEIEFC